ncbi:hypothetical protein [Streptomyces sp. NPDC001816]|uniref:hypothetical protein n=1 Tax=Streptomyces sp. NPDC001816 TaxID=3364612 RepID=UPI00367BC86A
MSEQRGARRRLWRWAVCAWAVAVVAGGGLTLWLQDSVRPQGPYGWESGDGPTPRNPYGGTPRPLQGTTGGDDETCPTGPEREPTQEAGRMIVACAYVTTRR